MKIKIKLIYRIILVSLFSVQFCLAQETVSQTDSEIIDWLRLKSTPIEHIEAENGFSDLQPLKKILKNVKVVGMGENTHGTREFFQVKHRLLEFLVTEMGFQAFAIESSYAPCAAINDYILYGKGNREAVLTGQGYVVWDTQEFSDMIDWMRTYNKNVTDEKKVRFYGLDFTFNEEGGQKVFDYLQKNSPAKVPGIDSLFQTVTLIEKEKWPLKMDEVQNELKKFMPRLQMLIDFLKENKEKLTATSSAQEFDEVFMYTQVMETFFRNNIKDSLPESDPGNLVRSRSMATNLFRILDMDKSVEKIVVWEHNSHISVGEPETGEPNFGHDLRNKYGNAYYAIGFEFYQGAYKSRVILADKSMGDLKTNTVAAASEGYVAWYLSRAMKGNSFLDLRAPAPNEIVEKWLNTPQIFRRFGWASDAISLQRASPVMRYDGILFIENSKPTRPTPNALKSVSKREGY